ncbi:fasciclin-like arabinogalactan protein 21 [Sesamum indicum]|uniref:Fasciclin-like arabinogalactan protein 21 n=1 Tax=Sesamum indicum TaxID=4182 RepID=A0A6I9TKE8_SESIN|nr:fasciclin-like arabinogalactan protein 21 [Sesamum indicum]
MANASCSHWWHAPLYLAMSITLAFIAITTTKESTPDDALPSGHHLAFNASRALRLHGGFHITATLLQISPELFFSGPESTIFAIQDSAISNLSIPPWAMRQLVRFHATPSALPMAELFKKPPGFCMNTLVGDKNLVITKNDAGTGSVMINNVLVSQPDLFLEGRVSVHGVLGPFDMILSPPCGFSNRSSILVSNATDQAVEWRKIVRLLNSNGFVSFAIGLNSALDVILQEYHNLGSVTIFAPPNSGFISSPSPFLDRIVRFHILPQRFTYIELAAAEKSSLRTLIPGYDLKIEKFSQALSVNGVEITVPDVSSSKNFVIHGISRDFDVDELFSSSK